MPQNPLAVFPEFYSNNTVGSLASVSRWTVTDAEHVPVNFPELLATGRVLGVHEVSNEALVTLNEITHGLPQAANCTFYLRSHIDGVAMLVINNTCPPAVVRDLLRIPSLYGEYRSSGPACQLVFPLPRNLDNFPAVKRRKVLTEPRGWYEILFEGWVVFSRNAMPSHVAQVTDDPHTLQPAWEELFTTLAITARQSRAVTPSLRLERPNLPRLEQILELMTRNPLGLTVAEFHGDLARYEYAVLTLLHEKLQSLLVTVQALEPGAVFTRSAEAWIITEAARRMLPHRNRDFEDTNGSPLLLDAATSVVATRPLFADAGTT